MDRLKALGADEQRVLSAMGRKALPALTIEDLVIIHGNIAALESGSDTIDAVFPVNDKDIVDAGKKGAKALTSKLTGNKAVSVVNDEPAKPEPTPTSEAVNTETGESGLSAVDELLDYAAGALGCNQTQAERRLIDAAKQEFNTGDLGKLSNDQLAAMYSMIQADKV